jgi:serine/threonine protein phosphatase PrpC/TolA-binding protein
MLKVTVGQITDKGLNKKRQSNEDNLLAMPEAGLYLVADGVGGRLGGEVASQTVVNVFSRVFGQKHNEDLRRLVKSTIELCNQKIYEDARSDSDLDGMATTIAMVVVEGNRAVVAHVGDSRVYRYDEHGLICLTQDHSEVGEALRAGRLTPEQAAKHPRRNIISRALGAETEVEPDFREIEIDSNTSFILCTDGVTRHVSDEGLFQLMQGDDRPQKICERIKDICYDDGAEDNLTAIVVDFGERRRVDDLTRPRMSASVAQSAAARAPERAPEPPPPPPPRQRIEVNLNPQQAPSGPLRTPKPQPPPVTAAPAPAAPPVQEREPGSPGNDIPPNQAPRKKPSLGTKQVTIKVPTVRMPEREEMSRVMKMSLLGGALLIGVALGLFLYGPFSKVFKGYLGTSDPYVKSPVRRPVNPEVASAYALHLEGRTAEARKELDDILLADGGNAEARFYLGRIDYDQKKYEDAILQMNEAVKLDSTLPDIWEHLALTYMVIGQSRNAMDCLQRAIKPTTPTGQVSGALTEPAPPVVASPKPSG